MIPNGFGDPITGFENPYWQTDSDTPYLTGGPTPWSTSSRRAFAFAPRGHCVSTSVTHGTRTLGGTTLFLYPLFTGVDLVRVLYRGHGPVLGVVVVVDLGWTFGWTFGAPRDDHPLRTRW